MGENRYTSTSGGLLARSYLVVAGLCILLAMNVIAEYYFSAIVFGVFTCLVLLRYSFALWLVVALDIRRQRGRLS